MLSAILPTFAACDTILHRNGSVRSITITPNTSVLKVGETAEFSMQVEMNPGPVPPLPPPFWTIDDPRVASVIGFSGSTTGVSPGRATLTASFGGKTATRLLQVVPASTVEP
ncbi:MAG TPA: Ig-like domain-containing protein [Vicinamibacteria bacterium]